MIHFSKIVNLLTNKGTKKGLSTFGLSCIVHDLFTTNNDSQTLEYVYFETSNNTQCLLYINPAIFETFNDINKKITKLTPWVDSVTNGYAIISDEQISVLPEITTSVSPETYVNLLNTLIPSTKSISYKLGIMKEDFLLVQSENDIKVFNIQGILNQNPKLLIVVDLSTLLNDLSTVKIERVNASINTILSDACEKYWLNLHSLLIKCQKLKIITKGKNNEENKDLVTKVVQLQSSEKAIRLALQNLELGT